MNFTPLWWIKVIVALFSPYLGKRKKKISRKFSLDMVKKIFGRDLLYLVKIYRNENSGEIIFTGDVCTCFLFSGSCSLKTETHPRRGPA